MFVREAQQRRLAGQRLGNGTLDLLGTLTALQNDLAGRVLHADLDLHGYVPPTVSEVRGRPRRTQHTLAR
ncbi:hypothetical protein GCM10017771_40090 [Streptomyces capitiformicae]|uniref:Uncharacterized protein n=1 Tax=Streptomyces capitiformicae TaxID=2014920 RepID=A0A919LAF2_9ACTN|nr:hypothetical protein GCM10017771_40090 [Streptomyces capitiformicae]